MPSNGKVFGKIYSSNRWGSRETVSGPGSTLAATEALRAGLQAAMGRMRVASLTDAPCGDFNWMSKMDLSGMRYLGVDVVPEIVAACSSKYGGENREFACADIVHDVLPAADMILCRDCLVHLSLDAAYSAVSKFIASGSKYLAATTFPAVTVNRAMSTGGWRALNMRLAPFLFSEPLVEVAENLTGSFSDKTIGIWEIESLRG